MSEKGPQTVALLPAGGRGQRMGGSRPKQYLELAGRPLLWHVLRAFQTSSWVDEIVLVVRPEDEQICRRKVLGEGAFTRVRALVHGGVERADSVRAGLAATRESDCLVLVHDGVRPFVSEDLIGRVVRAAAEHGAAVAALPAAETIKVVRDGRVVETPERALLWGAQTPQAFARDVLLRAHREAPPGLVATDDALLVERLGHPVQVVEGERYNLKITTPQDLEWAEWHLAREGYMGRRELRVGQGYDVHRLVAGRPLVLGGVEIPFARGLEGHSDADVLVHAIIDALLGAAALGDIGRLFPDSDEQYRGISSLLLLERVRVRLEERGARIVNIDAVLMAQRPKLAPHAPAMAQRLAEALGLGAEQISLKATTTERLGFVGREQGIAAQAVALVEV